jgi:ferrochelatase
MPEGPAIIPGLPSIATMTFRPEPEHSHARSGRVAVLLVNLGTPDSPTAPDLRRYLAEFLSDPRVVEIPRALWLALLHGVILRIRPAKSAAKYASIWTPEGSPLLVWTLRQCEALQRRVTDQGSSIIVRAAMRYGQPSVARVLDELKAEGVDRVLVLPLYPQYAAATTASVFDAVAQWSLSVRRLPEFRFVNHYHDDPGYIEALAQSVERHWASEGRTGKLVMSFHGIPARSLALGDPYFCECHKTARLLAERLGLSPDDHVVTFQSRLGRAKWLEPYTEPTLRSLASQGLKRADVICPGFSADCLETLEEIAQEARDAFLEAGGESFHYIPCVNTDDAWIGALEALVGKHLQGWSDLPATPAQLELQAARARAFGAER